MASQWTLEATKEYLGEQLFDDLARNGHFSPTYQDGEVWFPQRQVLQVARRYGRSPATRPPAPSRPKAHAPGRSGPGRTMSPDVVYEFLMLKGAVTQYLMRRGV